MRVNEGNKRGSMRGINEGQLVISDVRSFLAFKMFEQRYIRSVIRKNVLVTVTLYPATFFL